LTPSVTVIVTEIVTFIVTSAASSWPHRTRPGAPRRYDRTRCPAYRLCCAGPGSGFPGSVFFLGAPAAAPSGADVVHSRAYDAP
jgi:hypothetical protein